MDADQAQVEPPPRVVRVAEDILAIHVTSESLMGLDRVQEQTGLKVVLKIDDEVVLPVPGHFALLPGEAAEVISQVLQQTNVLCCCHPGDLPLQPSQEGGRPHHITCGAKFGDEYIHDSKARQHSVMGIKCRARPFEPADDPTPRGSSRKRRRSTASSVITALISRT